MLSYSHCSWKRREREDAAGFGASQGPTRSGHVHAVRHQVAASTFDQVGSNRESGGEPTHYVGKQVICTLTLWTVRAMGSILQPMP